VCIKFVPTTTFSVLFKWPIFQEIIGIKADPQKGNFENCWSNSFYSLFQRDCSDASENTEKTRIYFTQKKNISRFAFLLIMTEVLF